VATETCTTFPTQYTSFLDVTNGDCCPRLLANSRQFSDFAGSPLSHAEFSLRLWSGIATSAMVQPRGPRIADRRDSNTTPDFEEKI
jgi:hypothetical protein